MRLPAIDVWSVLAGTGMLVYPGLVWFGVASMPPMLFVVLGFGFLVPRIISIGRRARSPVEMIAFPLAAAVLAVLAAASPAMAARVYPVAISLGTAAVFAASLRYPPTVVERIARLTEPDLSPAGIAYTRKVTWIWVVFLVINAAISLWTALFGSLSQWALWNGLLSYLAMGALFAGEFLVRRRVLP